MTDEYLTHEEMLEIAAQREAENEEEEEDDGAAKSGRGI
jgi:hypothetical protein